MVLRAGYLVIAQKLQEAATAMCHEDIRTRLADALNDAFRGTGHWAYVVAVFGDDTAGDVVYSCNSDLKKAAYTISGANTTIATATAVDVQPLTTYEVETVEAREVGARNSKRDLRQLQTIHDSAKALGANCSMAEATVSRETQTGEFVLVESAAAVEPIILQEAKADYQIKLIAPGAGTSAYYLPAVLKRDGPSVFKEGTQVFLNHQTAAEAAARPEGDVRNLAGVLTTAAVYEESHAKGPGLYARMKVFADHAHMVEEKAPHLGMSIRALGTRSGETKDGLPVLAEIIAAKSVDVVTVAGAGGMILTEAAASANPRQEAEDMDATEVQRLIEAATAPFRDRALRGDATIEASRILAGITLPDASKQRVIDAVLRESIPLTEAKGLDVTKFTELVNIEAKREGAYVASLTGAGRVTGMGAAPVSDPVAVTQLREASQAAHKRAFDVFSEFGVPAAAAKAIAAGYGEAA